MARSHGPLRELPPTRSGWAGVPCFTIGSDFNFDYRVSFNDEELEGPERSTTTTGQPVGADEGPGISVFLKDGADLPPRTPPIRVGSTVNVAYHYMDSSRRAAMRGDGAPTCGFAVGTSIRADVRRPALLRRSGWSGTRARRILSGVRAL